MQPVLDPLRQQAVFPGSRSIFALISSKDLSWPFPTKSLTRSFRPGPKPTSVLPIDGSSASHVLIDVCLAPLHNRRPDSDAQALSARSSGIVSRNVAVVLGVNGSGAVGHDPAAALIIDGRLVAAVEEERLARVKRAPGLAPNRAVQEVLDLGGVTGHDLDAIAYPWNPVAMGLTDEAVLSEVRSWLVPVLGQSHAPIEFVEHHVAHAWSAVPFASGDLAGRHVVALVLDGSGESTSGAALRLDDEFEFIWTVSQAGSVGIYYEAITQYVGFKWGEEGKTMGLAAYGRPDRVRLPAIIDDRRAGPPGAHTAELSPRLSHIALRESFLDALRGKFGPRPPSAPDLARAGQSELESRVLSYASELLTADIDVLIYAGGVALNCTANMALAALCRDRDAKLLVPPVASDTGVAIGAAAAVSTHWAGLRHGMDPGLGRSYPADVVGRGLREKGWHVNATDPERVADLLLSGKIGAWYDGGSEVGPRALGRRSLIARPDSVVIRDRVNQVKRREPWRPLAPSVSRSQFDRSFAGSTPNAFMVVAAESVPSAAVELEGTVHVDGTARPQVVAAGSAFGSVLAAMGARTGVEAVLNTSFNIAGDALAYSPADAAHAARHMRLDFLAGDGWVAEITA
jgi:carbamoyltransferase